MIKLLPLTVVALFAGLAACTTPENRIRTVLRDAGLPAQTAACMADRMADQLSMGQLLKLQKASKTMRRPLRALSMHEFADLVRRVGDPEIVSVATRAGLSCTVLGG